MKLYFMGLIREDEVIWYAMLITKVRFRDKITMRTLSKILNLALIVAMIAILAEKGFDSLIRDLFDFQVDSWWVILALCAPGLSLYLSLFKVANPDDVSQHKDTLIGLWIEAKKSDLRKKID